MNLPTMVEAVTRDWWDEADDLDGYEALDADGKANAHADIEIVLASAIRHLKSQGVPSRERLGDT